MRSAFMAALSISVATPVVAQDPVVIERQRVETERAVQEARVVPAERALQRLREVQIGRATREASLAQQRNVLARVREVEAGRAIEMRRAADPLELRRSLERVREINPTLARTTLAMRPRLGISVALDARDTDEVGAYVNGVTPGGPADKAGIRAGDLITRIDGTSLTKSDGVRRMEGESVPGLRLIEVVGKLKSGKAVDIELRRGTSNRKVKVTPDDVDEWTVASRAPQGTMWRTMPGGGARVMIDSMPNRMTIRFRDSIGTEDRPSRDFTEMFPSRTAFGVAMGGPLARFELTALNASLGSYFGAAEGVLVINVPENSDFGLMAGDVITAVDGRKVTSRSQLMRIMGTYERAEEFKLQIMRQKRSESVTVKLP